MTNNPSGNLDANRTLADIIADLAEQSARLIEADAQIKQLKADLDDARYGVEAWHLRYEVALKSIQERQHALQDAVNVAVALMDLAIAANHLTHAERRGQLELIREVVRRLDIDVHTVGDIPF